MNQSGSKMAKCVLTSTSSRRTCDALCVANTIFTAKHTLWTILWCSLPRSPKEALTGRWQWSNSVGALNNDQYTLVGITRRLISTEKLIFISISYEWRVPTAIAKPCPWINFIKYTCKTPSNHVTCSNAFLRSHVLREPQYCWQEVML